MEIEYIPAKTIISGYIDQSEWFGANYNMNLYKGCCHGCIYCDSRSDCYRVENFDTVRAKKNAVRIVGYELSKKRRNGVVAMGAMSDPYNPFERELNITRNSLELIDAYHFGVTIATKSDLIVRDIDILEQIKGHSPVLCKLTVTTADDKLCNVIEPNVCVSSKRFEAIKALSAAGIFTGVLLMPMLPFITDTEQNIKDIVRLSHENGAKFILGGFWGFGMTLRTNQRTHYYNMLDKHFPGLKEKYISGFGNTYNCKSPQSKELKKLFISECKKYNLLYRMPDIINAYRQGYETEQMSLF